MKLILIRHGHSEANQDLQVYIDKKDFDIALSPKGIEQSKALAEKLNPISNIASHIFVSPYLRATETWSYLNPIFNNQITYNENPLIREQEFQKFTSVEEMENILKTRLDYDAFWYRYVGGESCADVYLRVTTFINYLMNLRDMGKIREDHNVYVICHEVVIRLILMILKNLKIHEAKMPIDNAEPLVIKLNERWEIVQEYKI